jgi:hypothetical protein
VNALLQVRDPTNQVIYSKTEVSEAELEFRNNMPGLHSFCFSVAHRSRTAADGMSSPRVTKPQREVNVDILLGKPVKHDRVTFDDVGDLMEDVSLVQNRLQELRSEVRHLRVTGAQHHECVLRKNRRVSQYSLGKMLVLLVMAIAQPYMLNVVLQGSRR